MSRALALLVLAACSSPSPPARPPANKPPAPVAATDGDCFGDATYLVRRTYDRTAHTITEHRVVSSGAFDVIMDVAADDKTFTVRGGPEGTGTLNGPAWAWTSWSGQFHTADSSMTTASDISDDTLRTQSEIHAGGSHTMGQPESYPRFSCADFAAREQQLVVPVDY